MKKAYIAYSCSSRTEKQLASLIRRLKIIDEGLKSLGIKSFIFLRDVQNWVLTNIEEKEIMNIAFLELNSSDLIIVDLDIPDNTKATGIALEVGYAIALNKKMITIIKEGNYVRYLSDISDACITYKNRKEIKNKLKNAINKYAVL